MVKYDEYEARVREAESHALLVRGVFAAARAAPEDVTRYVKHWSEHKWFLSKGDGEPSKPVDPATVLANDQYFGRMVREAMSSGASAEKTSSYREGDTIQRVSRGRRASA